jgi:hypothetical protein
MQRARPEIGRAEDILAATIAASDGGAAGLVGRLFAISARVRNQFLEFVQGLATGGLASRLACRRVCRLDHAYDIVRLGAADRTVTTRIHKALAGRTHGVRPTGALRVIAGVTGSGHRSPRGSPKERGAEQNAQGGAPRSWSTEESGQSVKFLVIHGWNSPRESGLVCRCTNSGEVCMLSQHDTRWVQRRLGLTNSRTAPRRHTSIHADSWATHVDALNRRASPQ